MSLLRRKKKPKKKKAPSKTRLRILADTLFSKLVRLVGACVNCGGVSALQCAHIVSRRYLCTRWDFDNAVCLCASCHLYYTHRPLEWEAWVIERKGEDEYSALKRKALGTCKPDYDEIIDTLKKKAA